MKALSVGLGSALSSSSRLRGGMEDTSVGSTHSLNPTASSPSGLIEGETRKRRFDSCRRHPVNSICPCWGVGKGLTSLGEKTGHECTIGTLGYLWKAQYGHY